MNDNQDAFGHALYDYFQGFGDCSLIIERSDGYIDLDIGNNYFSECKDWESHYREAMKHVKGRVLDIGCGAGRHSLYLQDIGFEVFGIDISPLAIETCKQRGLRDTKVMSIDDINIEIGRFDTILMLGNNFGLFGSNNKAKTLLKEFHNITYEKARIITESNDPYKTNNPFHLEYHELNRKKKRMSGQLKIRARYKKYMTPWFDYLMASKTEMEKIVEGTGWNI
ncbi:TPA: class I SAM-dependent methyltransferase [bacterium]|nr:class I SAM-dependent methyltransferase [bacterium]